LLVSCLFGGRQEKIISGFLLPAFLFVGRKETEENYKAVSFCLLFPFVGRKETEENYKVVSFCSFHAFSTMGKKNIYKRFLFARFMPFRRWAKKVVSFCLLFLFPKEK